MMSTAREVARKMSWCNRGRLCLNSPSKNETFDCLVLKGLCHVFFFVRSAILFIVVN